MYPSGTNSYTGVMTMLKKLLMLLLCCTMMTACIPACAEDETVTVFLAVNGYEVGADPKNVTVSTYPYDLEVISVQVTDTGLRPVSAPLAEKGAYFLRVVFPLDSNGNLSDRNGNLLMENSSNTSIYTDFRLTNGLIAAIEPGDTPDQIALFFYLDCPVAKTDAFHIQNYEYGKSVTDLVVTEDIPDAELCYHSPIPGWLLYELDTLTPVTSGTLKADTRYMLLVATHYVRPQDPPRGGYPRVYPGVTSTIDQGKVIFQCFDLSYAKFYGFLLDPLKSPAPTPTPVPVPEPPATGDGVRIALCLAAAYLSLNIVSFVRRRQRG